MPHIRHARLHFRHGGIVVEMILVLVVLLIVTIGVVQFGEFLAKSEQVALAARVGALEASQSADLEDDCADIPENVISAIEHQLQSSDIAWCQIRLEHNVASAHRPEELIAKTSDCNDCRCEPHAVLDCPSDRRYVRLTVCVPLSEVLPTQLSFFGAQIYASDKTYEHTSVFRYELGD
jgi:hypothetical protein